MPTGILQTLEAERMSLVTEGDAIATLAEAAGGAYSDEQGERLAAITARVGTLDSHIATERQRQAWAREVPAIPVDEPAASALAVNDGQPFSSLGDFLNSVRQAAVNQQLGMPVDQRLHQVQGAQPGRGANETVGADGGFLVQKDLRDGLLSEVWDTSDLLRRTDPFPVGPNANGVKLNLVDETSRATGSRFGGVRVYWTGEGGQKTASRPKIRPLEMQLQKLTGLLVATDELLEDATAYEAYARRAFREEMAFTVDDAILRGTGVGMPLGILNSSALVSASAEGGQAADSLVAENIWTMAARVPARSLARAEWFANQALIPQLAQLQLAIGTGGVPLYIPSNGLAGSPPFGTLWGRPLNFIEQASAPGDVGDIVLADLSQYMTISKGGIKEASSIHVYFDTDETAFRWVWRINGQPYWSTAVTPFKGSATLSPFVTLAAR